MDPVDCKGLKRGLGNLSIYTPERFEALKGFQVCLENEAAGYLRTKASGT